MSRRGDLAAAVARIEERLDGHTAMLADIQSNAKATNGRVGKLERTWWYARGFAGAFGLLLGVLGATGHLHLY